MYDINKIRGNFPILSREVNGKPLTYLDNGASAQKPQVVIDAITRGYAEEYSNVHRGLHYLSNLSTERYEAVRGVVQRFLNAAHEDEIIFNSGTTEGINMISYAWAAPRMQAGDEIILSTMEHHANIVPWHFLRERLGVNLIWVDPELDGALDPQKVLGAITDKTRLIAVTQCSNVLGTVVDVKSICAGARAKAYLFWWMALRGPCICRWTCRILAAISMLLLVINSMAPQALAQSTSAVPAPPKCNLSWAAAT